MKSLPCLDELFDFLLAQFDESSYEVFLDVTCVAMIDSFLALLPDNTQEPER